MLIIGIAVYFIILIFTVKDKKIGLKYALIWFATGVFMLLIAVFPGILKLVSSILGIYDETNTCFTLFLFLIILLLLSITKIITALNESAKRLTQELALLEKRVRDIEKDHNLQD